MLYGLGFQGSGLGVRFLERMVKFRAQGFRRRAFKVGWR